MGRTGSKRRDSSAILAADIAFWERVDQGDLEPVSGRLLEDARTAAGLSVEDAAALLKVDRDTLRRMEQGLIGADFADKATRILSGQVPPESENDMTDKDNGTDVHAATKEAREAHAEYERLNAEAMTLVQEFESALDRLMALAAPLESALKARLAAYARAVKAERARAKAAGEDVSREDSINITPWRRNVRVPQGVVNRVDLNCEYGVSLVPKDSEPFYSPADAVEYMPVAREVPMSARRRREQAAREGR